jgi:succinoglycan biosynthesis transport protein ExoP
LAEDRMRQIQDALSKAEADRATKQARYEAVRTNPEAPMSDVLATGPLRQYQENLQKQREELAQLKTLYTPTNYKVARVQAQIAETEKAIAKERDEIVGRLGTEYLAAVRLERLLFEAQKTQLRTVELQMDQERRYDVKKSETEATQRLYESMLQRVKEAGAASALRTTNVRVIDPASVPSVPYSPNSPLNMAIGFAIGALGGIGFVLLREGSDKVRRPGESILPDLPELGVIPSARGAGVLGRAGRTVIGIRSQVFQPGAVAWNRDPSLLAESFRAAVTSILFGAGPTSGASVKQMGGQVLVVTSIDVMAGKTTILTNLGIAAAERRQRVLLIDADLRQPRVCELVDDPNTWGLTDVLREGDFASFDAASPLEALTRPTRIPGLWVLPSGPVTAASPGLLYSQSSDLSKLLQRFRREFDLILIDTPPMMMYADGRILGRLSDGVVMVVRADTRRREEIRAACLRLRQDRIPVLGTILNDWKMDSSQARAYARYYDHYRSRPA